MLIEEMQMQDFVDVSKTMSKDMSILQFRNYSKIFAQDKEISVYEASAILFIAFDILKNDSFQSFNSTKERRIKELKILLKDLEK